MIPLAAVRWSSACVGFALCRSRDENRIGRSALIIFWVAVDAIEALTSISKDVFHGFNVMVARSEKLIDGIEPTVAAARTCFSLFCNVGFMEAMIGVTDRCIDGLSEDRTVGGCLVLSQVGWVRNPEHVGTRSWC